MKNTKSLFYITSPFLDSQEIDKKYNNTKLPNSWDLVEKFLKTNENIKYCMSYKTYYIYQSNIWLPITKDQLTSIIINFLKSNYSENYKKFNLKNLDDIFLLISHNTQFSLPDSIAQANKNGFLLPFLNGVLNTRTLKFFTHSPNNFTTHLIPLNYSKEDTIKDTDFSIFLSSIVNNNIFRLKILRACLYLILTNNLSYQVALYIYGPGGTGKSTLINILIYLLGKEVTLSSSISQVTSRFGIASIVGKILLILNDVSLYKGLEPKAIKNIVTQDPMQAEIKYQQPFPFTPNTFLMLTSNTLWDIKNSTTGLSRRMIYFPFDNVPLFKNLELFRILPDGEVVGSLVPYLSGFINWILSCPKENIDIIYQGGDKITELISPDLIHVNPLHVFVKECLLQDENSFVKIGNKLSNSDTLYGAYMLWAKNNGIDITKINQFSILLIDLLKQQGWTINKKRIVSGFIIKGISLNTSAIKNSINIKKEIKKTDKKELFIIKPTIDSIEFDN